MVWGNSPNPEDRPHWERRGKWAAQFGQTRADWMVRRIRNLCLYPNVYLMDTLSSLLPYDAAGIYLIERNDADGTPYIFKSRAIRGYHLSFELVEPRLEFLLDRQGDLQGQRRDGLEQHAPDRVIETAARDALTNRFRLRDPATLTDIRGPGGPLAAVIAHGHPIPTDPAHREPLEERGPLARGTSAAVGSIGLRVLT